MITFSKATSEKDLNEVLELQKRNLPENLSQKEKKEEGFVTVKHSLDILGKMNNACPHTIAKYNNKIIGYALSMTKDFGNQIEVLKPMFQEVSKVISDKKYIVMGQICIDKNHRKKGVFRGLYNYMKNEVCTTNFDLIITEIDILNERSINAHKAIGFKKLLDYKSEGKNWRIVSLEI